MTHESVLRVEAPGGPERDHGLPAAELVPVADGPEDLPPVDWPDLYDSASDPMEDQDAAEVMTPPRAGPPDDVAAQAEHTPDREA